ncbi:hypothetical protein Tco_0064184 [Tanacetum coccineum]
MTRSSTKELFIPFENPEREFRSSRKLFMTPSIDEWISPEFDLFYDLEEHSEEEVAETMAETMDEYMCKTRGDYGSGVTRPKIDDKDHFELKGQFLKELRDNTFSSSDHEDANEHIETVLEIINLINIPNITQDQIMLRAFPMSLTGAEVIFFYNGLEVLTRQILDSKGAIPTKTAADAKVAIQEMAEYSQKWHNRTSRTRSTETSYGLAAIKAQLNNLGREIKNVNEKVYGAQVGCELLQYRAAAPGIYQRNNANPLYQEQRKSMEESLSKFMNESTKRHEENSNLIKEIRASIDTVIKNQGASIKALEIQVGKLILEPRQATIPFPIRLYDEEKGSYGLKYLDTYSIETTFYDDSLLKKEKDPGNRTVKHPKGIAENVLVGIGKFVFPVDFIILDMPKDVNVPLILGRPFLSIAHAKSFRNRVDDLEPTIEECEVVNEPMRDIVKTRCDFIGGLDDYPRNCDFDRRIHVDCAYNLKFSCMMGFEYVDANFLSILPINVMTKKFYNSIMKDKIEFKGRNELGNFVNPPVFIGKFYVITVITVVEDMYPYLDERMGDVIVGEPFCKASYVEAKRFDGIITIRDRDDSVTYQMVQSNPRLRHLTKKNATRSYHY